MPSRKRNPLAHMVYVCSLWERTAEFATSLFTAVPPHTRSKNPVYTRYMLRTNQQVTSQQKPFVPQYINIHEPQTQFTLWTCITQLNCQRAFIKHLAFTDAAATTLAECLSAATESVSSDCPRRILRRRFWFTACSA